MDAFSIKKQIDSLRQAQLSWKNVETKQRAVIAGRVACLIAEQAEMLHASIQSAQRMDFRETLSAEVIPLADAARWLAKNANKILKDRKVGWYQRPIWLGRVCSIVSRDPVGVVLIIGTWNYPLFLTGVQMLQAVVAGNAVIVKPAIGCEAITACLQQMFVEAGVPPNLIAVLDSTIESAEQAIDVGIDKAVMTGSSQSGRKVLARLSSQLVPAALELSGCDAVFVLEAADLDRVTDALLFGLRLNGGATCLAPRRVYIPQLRIAELEQKLKERLSEVPRTTVPDATCKRIIYEIEASHAKLLKPSAPSEARDSALSTNEWIQTGLPIVLTHVGPSSSLANADIFAPLLMLFPYENIEEAIQQDCGCPYGLSASLFGKEDLAKCLAAKLNVGTVVINDMIAPTADPRLPFGGVRESGFGVTRGPEGLLEMTRPKVISVRRGRWLPHLDTPKPRDEPLLVGILQWLHSPTWSKRMKGLFKIVNAIRSSSSRDDAGKTKT